MAQHRGGNGRQTRDAPAAYRKDGAPPCADRQRRLRFDRGTLLYEGGVLPEPLAAWFVADPRVDGYRAPAYRFADPLLRAALRNAALQNSAPRYRRLALAPVAPPPPYPHQRDALAAWDQAGRRGLVVLPTGAGKTWTGLWALARCGRDALIVVPTIDLLHQWYAQTRAAFPDLEIGLLGGGYHDIEALTIATYDSAARHADRLGNRFGLLLFDEVHHLPSEFYRCIAEFSLAPYRLGLSATPERGDGRDAELDALVGPVVYRRAAVDLAGNVLAPFQIRTLSVELSPAERADYRAALDERNAFLRAHNIGLGSIQGWNLFVMRSAASAEGRRAMRAHQRARRIASATPAKLRLLATLLAEHVNGRREKMLIFTEDNATAYEVARRFLIPCMSHQTRVKERQQILDAFRDGRYRAVVTSKVLNEGVDVPDASVGVVLSGSGSNREFVQRLGRLLRRGDGGKRALLYEVIARATRDEGVAERRREPPQRAPGAVR